MVNAKGTYARIQEYERQLKLLLEAPPKQPGVEEKASDLRSRLCEVLVDLMMADPSFAYEKDAYQRLWNGCFYTRISVLRSKISREKKRKNAKKLELMEQEFTTFLKESVTLYDYVIDKMQSKFLLAGDKDESSPALGIVEGLFKLYIHIGDLYRYQKSIKEAETAYNTAAKLGPGKGNPFNQLAVLTQLKQNDANSPQSCVTFYLYARGMLPTCDPFPSAKGNLRAALNSNRKVLEDRPSLDEEERLLGVPTKKGAQDFERRKRSIASRRFLAEFVDLHFDLITFPREMEDMTELELVQKMEQVITDFSRMLAQTALGDPLLVKMVAICAFSVALPFTLAENEVERDPTLSRAFLLKFATALADRVICQGRKGNSISYRYLSPLLLVSELAAGFAWSVNEMSEFGLNVAKDSEVQMWSSVSEVANYWHVRSKSDLELQEIVPKDLKMLQGFLPFEFLKVETNEKGFISPQDAMKELEIQKANNQGASDHNRIRLARFAAIMTRMNGRKVVLDSSTGMYRVFSTQDEVNMVVGEEGYPTYQDPSPDRFVPDTPMQQRGDEFDSLVSSSQPGEKASTPNVQQAHEKDILVYRQAGDGKGPALLVPGDLLVGSGSGSGRAVTSEIGQSEKEKEPKLPPPPGLLPPPGFVTVTSPQLSEPVVQPRPFTDGILQENMDTFDFATSQRTITSPPVNPSSFNRAAESGRSITMFEYLQSQPVPETANPFMTTVDAMSLATSVSPTAPTDPATLFQQQDNMDGMELLDSSLIQSLWGTPKPDKPITKNPFFFKNT